MRSNGTKISNFPANTALPADTQLTFISNGVNYRVGLADFQAALSVTGTIAQGGDAGDTPVLEQLGSVNRIRNIHAGFGISSSIDANNSLEIATDFSFNEVGVALVDDPSASAAVFRSLVAGTGINIAGSNGEIQIVATGIPSSTKTITVNQLSDLPAPISSVINLVADTHYLFIDDVDTGINRVALNGNVISAVDASIIKLTYTGTGDMFTAVGTTDTFEGIKLACPNGDLFNIDGSGTGIFQLLNMNIESAQSLGVVKNVLGMQITNIFAEDYTVTGFLFEGANGVFVSDATLMIVPIGTMYDLGTSTWDGFTLTNCFPNVSAGATFISGLANSGNINTGGFGTLANIIQSGLGDLLNGLSVDDIRWQFALNNTVRDSHQDSLSYNTAGVVVPIAAINTPVAVGGTWVDDNSSQFTVDGAGTVTYIGVKELHVPISVGMTVNPVSGSNKDYTAYIAINGVAVAASGRVGRASSTDRQSITPIWQHQFQTGDTCSVMVENNSDTIDLNVSHAVLRVN